MTWAWKSSKVKAAVVLQLSGGLRIERPGGLSQKGGVAKGKEKDVAKLGEHSFFTNGPF